MPELPEVTVYIEALERYIGGKQLERARIRAASLLKTAGLEGNRRSALLIEPVFEICSRALVG